MRTAGSNMATIRKQIRLAPIRARQAREARFISVGAARPTPKFKFSMENLVSDSPADADFVETMNGDTTWMEIRGDRNHLTEILAIVIADAKAKGYPFQAN